MADYYVKGDIRKKQINDTDGECWLFIYYIYMSAALGIKQKQLTYF